MVVSESDLGPMWSSSHMVSVGGDRNCDAEGAEVAFLRS
jgi:hypothetical protein